MLATRKVSGHCPPITDHRSPITSPSLFAHPFAIAGFRYYDGTNALPELAVGTRLTLRAEPANPHDPHAVEILHGPAKLGYVPRFCNRHVSLLLQDGVPLACDIERLDPQSPPWDAVSVRIHLLQAGPTSPAR